MKQLSDDKLCDVIDTNVCQTRCVFPIVSVALKFCCLLPFCAIHCVTCVSTDISQFAVKIGALKWRVMMIKGAIIACVHPSPQALKKRACKPCYGNKSVGQLSISCLKPFLAPFSKKGTPICLLIKLSTHNAEQKSTKWHVSH